MTHYCFKHGCESEVQYVCQCLSSETFCCEFHVKAHLKLPNRSHAFYSVPINPCEWTKGAVHQFLVNLWVKTEKLKKIEFDVLSKNVYSNKECLRMLDTGLEEIKSLIEKINQVSEEEQLINPLLLQDYTVTEKTTPKNSEIYSDIKTFCKLITLRYITSTILNRINNDTETEQYYRKAFSSYEFYTSSPLISKAYSNLSASYQRLSSCYLIDRANEKSILFAYNTETEAETQEVLQISAKLPNPAYIGSLPNGDRFCFGDFKHTWIAWIIDINNKFIKVISGMPFRCSLAIYFNRNIYCFGERNASRADASRFDLDENRWINLSSSMPISGSYSSIIAFHRNILISRWKNIHLLLYSIDIDSFSVIPYEFSEKRSILINNEERLYLIECKNGYIYENEVGDEYGWNKIGKSIINSEPNQTYFSYNKGGIYISNYTNNGFRQYFKFEFENKTLIETACYNKSLSLRKCQGKLEEINCYEKAFKIDNYQHEDYFNKGYSLYNLGEKLLVIQQIKKIIKVDPSNPNNYLKVGYALHDLNNHKAIKYFNKAINLAPIDEMAYLGKGYALHDLGHNSEALECYNEAIKLNPYSFLCFCYRANLLNDIAKEEESWQDFNKAFDLMRSYSDCYLYNEILLNDCLELIAMLSKLQKCSIELQDKLKNFKEISKTNNEIIEEIEIKENKNKEQHSSLLKRAVRCLDLSKNKSIGEMQHIKIEINECQEAVDDIIAQLVIMIS